MRRWVLWLLGACLVPDAWADTATFASGGASALSGNTPTTLQFPLTRTGDIGYDAILSYHTIDGSAIAGVDYTAVAGDLLVPAGARTANIAVPVAADTAAGSNKTFQLVLDSVLGVGPAPNFDTAHPFATGANPNAVATADINGDGLPDLIVASSGDNIVSVLLDTTTPGAAAPSFASQQTFATGTKPAAVTVADVNGDGKPDLIVANLLGNTVSVLLNTTAPGATTPSFAAQQTFATGMNPIAIAAVDLNGDGKLDLVIANSGDNTVSVLRNTTAPGAAAPSFAAQQVFAAGATPHAVATADFNGDGKADVVVANFGDNDVSVLLNTTSAGAATLTFAAQQTFAAGTEPAALAVADIDGDGKPDVIVANFGSDDVSVLLDRSAGGAATPSFAAQQTFTVGTAPVSIAVRDVNGDGRPDLIAANSGSDNVSILLNTTVPGTTPRFAAQQTVAAGTQPQSIALADVNNDGTLDLIAANYDIGTVSVLQSAVIPPAQYFAATQMFPTGAGPESVAVADINGDNLPDLIVANQSDHTISVLLSTTSPGATPSFAAQQTFASANHPHSVTAADINGDGKIDVIFVTDSGITVLLNTTAPGAASASFAAAQTFAGNNNAQYVTTADINGDNLPDLVFTNGAGAVVLLNTTAPGTSTLSFAPPQTFGQGSAKVAAADVNGDGKPDLIVPGADTVLVLLNTTATGATTPTFAPQQSFARGIGAAYGITAADINRDGKLDLIVTNEGNNGYGSNSVSVLLNLTPPGASTLSFAPTQNFYPGAYPTTVTAADVNGDGAPDVILTNGNGFAVLLNTTAPAAAVPSFATVRNLGAKLDNVVAADVNGDGRMDLIGVASSGVGVLLNTVAGAAMPNFAASLPANGCCRGLIAADIDGDGKPDLIALTGDISGGHVEVVLNATQPGATAPSFVARQTFAVGAYPLAVAAGDFNGDGKLDLVVANEDGNTVSVLINSTPAGSTAANFAPQQTFAAQTCPESVAVADLNGDGKPDVLVGGLCGPPFVVLLNTTAPGAAVPSFAATNVFTTESRSATIADLNGDGIPDLIGLYASVGTLVNTTTPGAASPSFAPLQRFSSADSTVTVTVADINGDGRPDLITVLNAFAARVLLNTTPPGATTLSFAAPQDISTGYGADGRSVFAADIDGDGKPDLIVGNSVLLNTTPAGAAVASFAAPQVMPDDATALADLNGDGKPDLLATTPGPVGIRLNAQYQTLIGGAPIIGTIVIDAIYADGFE